jgi:deoxycytidine triphosphate deaminase
MDRQPVSVLSDGTIMRLVREGRIRIEPWDESLVQPASVDLRLGDSFRVFHNHRASAIDLRQPPANLTEEVVVGPDEPFVIHPGEFCLARTEEWIELPDDVVARIEGKALALDTHIPTPSGWKLMGELQVGDLVFDELGHATRVVAATAPMLGRPCREVVLSDRTTIVADVEHEWEVRLESARPTRALTTGEMESSLRRGKEWRFRVPQAAPVDYPAKELPVPPYVLGVWIGDGTSSTAEITSMDEPILREVELAGCGVQRTAKPIGYRIGGAPRARDERTGRYTGNASIHSRLREMNLLGNKHIPSDYMQAGIEQRRALLAGLMDTDGYVDRWGRCELTTTSLRLADQYRELVASLGFRPVVAKKPAWMKGKDCGPKYDVTFTPHEPVFRLPRKLQRQRQSGSFNSGRAVVAIRRTPSVPVRCIEVASPRGLFLATRSFIPTHNSSLGRLGLIVHATAGFCDPGWKGTLTLELNNLTRVPIRLYPGLPIAQLSFMMLDAPALRPYGHEQLGSHYQGQVAATESRYHAAPAGRPPRFGGGWKRR